MSAIKATPMPAESDNSIKAEAGPMEQRETMMRRDGYMKPKEASEDLGCGERFLRDGANKYGFPHTRLGQALWFSPEERAEIRKLCHKPAEPGKIAQFRRSRKTAARKPVKSAA